MPPAAGRPGARAPAPRRPTCGGAAEEQRLRAGPFPPGEVSRGRGGAGPRAEVLAGPRRGAEARRLCCFGYRAAAAAGAAAAAATKTVAVTAAATGAALGEQQRGWRPLAQLRRGRPGAERSSCATVSAAGRGAAPVPLRPRSAAGVGLQGADPACEGRRGRGSGRRGLGREQNPRGSGLHVSSFGALPSWGPSSPGPWLGTEPRTSGYEAGGLLIKFLASSSRISTEGVQEKLESTGHSFCESV